MTPQEQAARSHAVVQSNIRAQKARCDRALEEWQRPGGRGFCNPRLMPYEGRKLSVAELCAECGLLYDDGKVHTPPMPIELKRVA